MYVYMQKRTKKRERLHETPSIRRFRTKCD